MSAPLVPRSVPAEAYAAALASLPAMGPARLAALLGHWRPMRAWQAVGADEVAGVAAIVEALGNRARDLAARWASAARACDVSELWQRYEQAGVGVAALGSAAMPAPLAGDLEPPGVVFFAGDPDVITGPRVAIVGTRRCTRYGADVARELARDLAAVGVGVVSGLALGIDGAAHAGALAAEGAPPVAVVGSGLDVVYPRQHNLLWQRVREAGVVLSEAPLGARPEAWRFPARNRLIAALADVVVVVESHERGGSMHTVTEAERRDRPVLAVPGPVRSPASAGTNRLIAEGAGVARDTDDVLVALGLSPGSRRRAAEHRSQPVGTEATVLEAIGWQPASLDQLLERSAVALGALMEALTRLEARGWVAVRGGWYERVVRETAS